MPPRFQGGALDSLLKRRLQRLLHFLGHLSLDLGLEHLPLRLYQGLHLLGDDGADHSAFGRDALGAAALAFGAAYLAFGPSAFLGAAGVFALGLGQLLGGGGLGGF